ncbi:hypothetical protein MKX03_026650 [Papaver bracteatum]|nr:hypothetical protein MKX03_026650 [Papaver bracteatum]
MDLQGKVPSFHPRRSPRIIERKYQQQRDAELQRRREKRDSMTEVEKKMLLEKRRNAYRIRKAKIGCGNTAEISNQGNDVDNETTTFLQLIGCGDGVICCF